MLHILLVEDEPGMRSLMVELLRRRYPEAEINVCNRVTSAWNELSSPVRYDLVIMDGNLLDGKGAPLVTAWFGKERPHRLVFLGVSASPEDLQTLQRAGCEAVLLKPFGIDSFIDVVHELLFPKENDDESTIPTGDRLPIRGDGNRELPAAAAG